MTVTREWVDFVSLAFSGSLVAIGAFAVVYAIRTLKAVERQTKANEGQLCEIKAAGKQTEKMIKHAGKQAEAALLNAQILANAERPWILIVSQRIPGTKASALIARNCGRTPALLVLSSESNWKLMKQSELIDLKPERPTGTCSTQIRPRSTKRHGAAIT